MCPGNELAVEFSRSLLLSALVLGRQDGILGFSGKFSVHAYLATAGVDAGCPNLGTGGNRRGRRNAILHTAAPACQVTEAMQQWQANVQRRKLCQGHNDSRPARCCNAWSTCFIQSARTCADYLVRASHCTRLTVTDGHQVGLHLLFWPFVVGELPCIDIMIQKHAGSGSLYLHNMALAIVQGTLRLHPGEEAAPSACSSRALLGGFSCPGRGSRLDACRLLGSCLGCCSFGLWLSSSAGGLLSSRRGCSRDCCSISASANLGAQTRFLRSRRRHGKPSRLRTQLSVQYAVGPHQLCS